MVMFDMVWQSRYGGLDRVCSVGVWFCKAVKASFGVVWCVKFGQLRRCMFC